MKIIENQDGTLGSPGESKPVDFALKTFGLVWKMSVKLQSLINKLIGLQKEKSVWAPFGIIKRVHGH